MNVGEWFLLNVVTTGMGLGALLLVCTPFIAFIALELWFSRWISEGTRRSVVQQISQEEQRRRTVRKALRAYPDLESVLGRGAYAEYGVPHSKKSQKMRGVEGTPSTSGRSAALVRAPGEWKERGSGALPPYITYEEDGAQHTTYPGDDMYDFIVAAMFVGK